jgi:4a-hydroxytetrahydrobiopterin dehydratase
MATSDPPPRAAAYAAISPEDAYRALAGHPAWIVERDRIHRDIRLGSFMEAIDLITRVAAAAEAMRHHPNIRLHEWCFVDFEVYSHLTGGISRRDVELALAIDELIEDIPTA